MSMRDRSVAATLQALEAQLAGVLLIADDAIISVNAAQRILVFNRGAEKIFGYRADEVLEQPLDLLLPARFHDSHPRHIQAFAHAPVAARTMGERREIWGRRKSGEEFPAEASIAKLATGAEPMFTVILRDITARKQVADALEHKVTQRTEHLNTLLQFSQELFGTHGLDEVLERAIVRVLRLVPLAHYGAIFLVDRVGEPLTLRASAGIALQPPQHVSGVTGLLALALRTKQAHIVSTPSEWDRLRGRDAELEPPWIAWGLGAPPTGAAVVPLLAQPEQIGVLLILRITGEGAWTDDIGATLQILANLTAAAAWEEQQSRTAVTLSTRLADLETQQHTMTERVNAAEASVLQTARLAAVGQLAASVAHEINNPLYAARNALFLLEEDLRDAQHPAPYLTLASEQLTRIAHIIERMRDFYRPARGELGPCDLNQLLAQAMEVAELNLPQGSEPVVLALASSLPPVIGNGDQLRQVFLNLLMNAIEAMPTGGTLTIRTERGPTMALVEIEDTGSGIPAELRTRLFEPFFTTKRNGTGLGLSISAHIVTQHNGQIEVDSTPGHGTTFRIGLPYGQPLFIEGSNQP